MRYKCIVSYDGTNYHGFQVQGHLKTVQEELEKVLLIINKRKTTVYPAGRTDAKVHALGQVIHFNTPIIMEPFQMKNALNSRLPRDIYVKNVEIVSDDFHARFQAKSKTYQYLMDLGEFDPLKANYRYYYRYNLDTKAMQEALKLIVGEHDFKSFTKNHKLSNTQRIINFARLEIQDSLLTFTINGNGFMHNMVRIIMAMLIEVGKGKISPEQFYAILMAKNRSLAPKTAPANGLYLVEVIY